MEIRPNGDEMVQDHAHGARAGLSVLYSTTGKVAQRASTTYTPFKSVLHVTYVSW